jgi:acyl-CoA synthetase (AMP-forming)/AMP-acid ligase II
VIYRSPCPDVEIPDVPLTTFILRHAAQRASKPALIDGPSGRMLNYGQLADGARRVAAGLARRGFRQGDVLATICPSVPEFALAFYGVAALGGATTMLNPLYTAAEMHRQLTDSGARFVLTVPECFAVVREAVAGTRVAQIFVLDEIEDATSFHALLQHDEPLPLVPINPNDVVLLPYSSGTTGCAKGVMLTHRNLIASVTTRQLADPIDDHDTVVSVYPLFHIAGITHLNISLHAGASHILLPRYDLQTLLRLLQDYRATRIGLVPPVVLELARHPMVDQYDLSRLERIYWGAAPMDETVARACRERLGVHVKQAYGMTETTGAIHLVPIDEDRSGSTGPPLAGSEHKIVDLVTGATLPAGQTGEICVRGPLVMKGYLNQPEATAQTIDAEGWLHTGDIGWADDDGWLTAVDRLKEFIKYKGYQVAPAELEAILLTHPVVADVAVIPSPDEAAGEVPKAFVVLQGATTADELMSFVAIRVAPYKKVRRFEFVDTIPKSASGKILRRMLVERERAASRAPVLV